MGKTRARTQAKRYSLLFFVEIPISKILILVQISIKMHKEKNLCTESDIENEERNNNFFVMYLAFDGSMYTLLKCTQKRNEQRITNLFFSQTEYFVCYAVSIVNFSQLLVL